MPAVGVAIAGLHTELAGLRSDLQGMPADSRCLADDVEVVHRDLEAMKAALAETTASVAPVHAPICCAWRTAWRRCPMPCRRCCPRGELSEQLDGLRTDLSGLPFMSKTARLGGYRRAA